MTARVQIVDGEFRVVLTPEMAEALHLTDGAEVEVRPLQTAATTYASVDEVLEAFRATEPRFRATYKELAK